MGSSSHYLAKSELAQDSRLIAVVLHDVLTPADEKYIKALSTPTSILLQQSKIRKNIELASSPCPLSLKPSTQPFLHCLFFEWLADSLIINWYLLKICFIAVTIQ